MDFSETDTSSCSVAGFLREFRPAEGGRLHARISSGAKGRRLSALGILRCGMLTPPSQACSSALVWMRP